jgi:cyclophilin family peptidyl-prolyl cis-trans isomerase
MELSSADQIEQEFADELQNMSIKEEAAPVKKPSLARGFSEIDPNNEAAARGTSAQKQGSFSARQLPDEPSYRVALQSRYGSVAPPLARTFTESDPSSPISPAPKLAPKPPARTFTEPERPFPPTEPAKEKKDALIKAARDAVEVEAAEGRQKPAAPAAKPAPKPAPKKAPPAKSAPKKKKLTARERTQKRMSKGKRVTQKLKRRSKQLFQVSMWMLLVAAFVAGFLYIRRRWAETPSIIPLEDVFGAPFNKHVELEVTVDNKQAGSLRFELLDSVATETAQAFSQRCSTGAHDGNEFYRIVPGFVMQGGDDSEDREDLTVKPFKRGLIRHDRRGLLVMVRAGPYQMTSQFFITLKDAPMLDGRHVVFGALADGVDVLEKIEAQGDAEGAPLKPVRIASCKVVESAGGTAPLFPPAENYGRVEL